MNLLDKAEYLISDLGSALAAQEQPGEQDGFERLAAGTVDSARVCWTDAEWCFAHGKFVEAANRARKGLAYLGVTA